MFMRGSGKLTSGDYEGALQDLDGALRLHCGLPFSQDVLEILLKRAECLLLMGLCEESLQDCDLVISGCHMIKFPEGLCCAVKLRMKALELTDKIKQAFQMALIFMCMSHSHREGKEHVDRLRAKLEASCSKNANLVDEIQESLMKTALKLFKEGNILGAAEHFAEVIKLVCKHVFISEAYLHHAKCLLEMGFHKEARQSCLTVLEHDPDNGEGKALMAQIDACIQKEEEGRRKKTKKKASNSMLARTATEPDKKPVMNNKQRKQDVNAATGLAKKGTDKSHKIQEQTFSDVGSMVTRGGGNSSVDSRNRQHGAAMAKHLRLELGWPSLPPDPSFSQGNQQSNSNPEHTAGEWTLVTSKKPTQVSHTPQEKEQQFSTPSGKETRLQSAPQQTTAYKYQTSFSPAKQKEEPSQYHEARSEKVVHQLLLERPRDPFLRTSHVPSLQGATSLNYFSEYCTSVPLSETNRNSLLATKTKRGISLISQTTFDYLKQPDSQTELARNANSNEARHGIENISSPLIPFVQDSEFQGEAHASRDERRTPSPCQPQSIGLYSTRSTSMETASIAMQASSSNWSSLPSFSTGGGPTSAHRLAQEEPLLKEVEGKATVSEGKWKEGTSESENSLQQFQIEESSSNGARRTMEFEAERRGYEEISSVKLKCPNNQATRTHSNHGAIGTAFSIASSEPLSTIAEAGSSSSSSLPNGILLLCQHFLKDNKKRKGNSAFPKPCVGCEKRSNFVYGAWNNSRKEWQKMRPYPRLNPKVDFRTCRHYESGKKCQKSPCNYAHGDKELTVWTLQRKGDLPPPNEFSRPTYDVSGEPQQRGTLTIHQLKESSLRPPPAIRFKEDYRLCDWWKGNLVCRNGSSCTFAHGEDELRAWMSYLQPISQDATTSRGNEEESLHSLTDRNEPIPESKWVRNLPGVKVSVEPEERVILQDNKDCHTFQWTVSVTFKAHEVGQLSHIDLLHRYHHCYRLVDVKIFVNNKEQFSGKTPKERWSYKLPEINKAGLVKAEVGVCFESRAESGTFTQCLAFLFGKTTYLMQGLNVDIGRQEVLSEVSKIRQELEAGSSFWTQDSMEVVRSPKTSTMFQDEHLLKRYNLPDRLENIVSAQVVEGNVTCKTYRRAMHQLLFVEERSMKSEISKYGLHEIQLLGQRGLSDDMTGMTFAANDELFGILRFQEGGRFNPDDSAGRLLLRNVCSVWLKLSGGHDSRIVYEVPVEKVTCENVVLRLPSVTCNELQVTDNCDVSVDAQFQLNRQPLCEQHAAIDRLGPLQMMLLFPEQKTVQVKREENLHWRSLLDPRLNKNQEEVIRSIAAPGQNAPPLVVFGPFGTGKTFTLNQAVRHLVTNTSHRVLLCTHSNRAADIHVELLHEYLTNGQGIQASKPLRIYQPMRRLATASQTARAYSRIDHETDTFALPTRKDVIDHRVVITTLATSELLLRLQLNHGFFTHILVDEAAQALEPEALTPLALAGPNTKVVFTGDHMQMSPEVYSQRARDWGLQRSLPERLFDHYSKSTNPDSMSPNVVFLTENYRCHPDILQFPSDNFYGKELVARGSQLAHPRFGPLLFFSARGEERREADNSYMNAAEVHEVVKRVKELADDWPDEWGPKVLSEIAVLSAYRAQVQAIRSSLRKQHRTLKDVTVDTIHNVQGQEFRALFISTVRTAHTCQRESGSSQRLYLEFLSDPKLLNTAVTRAKSLVAVVGDPVSLCTIGECRGNWWDFIKRCNKHQSLHGTSYGELQGELNALLAKIPLNSKASPFVPKATVGSKECSDALQKAATGGCSNKQNKSEETGNEENPPSTGMDQFDHEDVNGETQEDECKTANLSQEEAQDCSGDTSDISNGFRREDLDDEAVFPIYLDTIIQALVKKCKETMKGDANRLETSDSTDFPTLEASKSTNTKASKNDPSCPQQGTASMGDFMSEDYEIRFVNGRPKVHLVNLGIHQVSTVGAQRSAVASRPQTLFVPELLQRLLHDEPERYLACTLRLSAERSRIAYAVVSDTTTPDIVIRGRVRQAFDMDRVVIEKMGCRPATGDNILRIQGKMIGVLKHIISPHERQYVCNADYESPGVMLPINKSVTKLVNLSESRCKGMPIYRKDPNGRAIRVNMMEFEEVLSGKYLFLVRYLQWRPDCVYPLGAVVRKIPKIETLKNSLEVVFTEHGIRREFDKNTVREARQKFPSSWSVPPEEVSIRRRVDKAFTIDPATSLDLDDALSLEEVSDATYRVGVHIADVSYFVRAGTDLDKEALRRCTSYYPGHGDASIPMLPRELSENHCSLLPDKDRLCISLYCDLSDEGEIVGKCNVERTIVRSCCKLSYPDTQKILDGQNAHLQKIPKDVQQSVRFLSHLTQKRRNMRLGKGAFDHWDANDDPQNFRAHELVEEMMILANENIANLLSNRNPEIAPLRTQLPPKDHRLNAWFKEHGKYTKFSLRIRRYFSEEEISKLAIHEQDAEEPVFKIQESVWSDICHAADIRDLNRLQELICNEANHPQLAVANSQFNRIQPKAQYLCKGDEPDENVQHFSMKMSCYTHFTSPIRRYVDLEVHRLVVALLQESQNQPLSSREHVEKVCRRSTFVRDNARKFERECSRVHLGAQLKEKSRETTAFISVIDNQFVSFEISQQEDDHLTAQERRIPMSNFTPTSVKDKQDSLGLLLEWKFRMYMYTAPTDSLQGAQEKQMVTKILSLEFSGKEKVIDLPGDVWQRMLGAVQAEDCNELTTLIRKGEEEIRHSARSCSRELGQLIDSGVTRGHPNQHPRQGKAVVSPEDVQHFYEKSLLLRKYDVAHLQLTAHMFNGILHPEIQLFKINPQLHICLEHQKYPRECFAMTSRYQASWARYETIEAYIDAWKPVLAMEAATGAVKENDGFVIQRLEVKWRHEGNDDKKEASFILSNSYCTSRQLGFFPGDFVCLRARSGECGKKTATLGDPRLDINDEGPKSQTGDLQRQQTHESRSTGEASCDTYSDETPLKPSDDFWVGHYIVKDVKQLPESISEITMDLHHSSSTLPEGLLDGENHPTTLSLIHRSLPYRRMFFALCINLKDSSELAQSICLGIEPAKENYGTMEARTCKLNPLNKYQEQAVREALRKPFTLIQGPPGTGKTVTGVHLAYWFTKRNMQLQTKKEVCKKIDDPADDVPAPKAPPQVMYCGPSNKSVDVVADYMLRIPELKIIRVYSTRICEAEFPIPNKLKPLMQASEDESKILNDQVKAISLHHVIRGKDSPFADKLRTYEEQFAIDRSKGEKTGDGEVEKYRKLISKAENWALQRTGVQVILCTCTAAGRPRIGSSCDNIQQCIVDECGMCMEPETLVPITCSGARQVVLIGDHKQLQPIIQDNVAKSLGLNVSMFERLSARAIMLETQYRMHSSICEFPSNYFYDGKLQTDPLVPKGDPRLQSFWPAQVRKRGNAPMAFCHVEGQEESTAIRTADSNEQSKANKKEVLKAVQVAKLLVNKYNVRKSDVIILSPYRAQRSKISERLEGAYEDIQVTTIAKSQGSEWDYVIISLVRSMKKDELDPEPSLQWLRKHLGFVTDEHQINVGLTRARKGLCIIGNKNLLCNDSMWQNLLEHYEKNHCVVDESWPWNT